MNLWNFDSDVYTIEQMNVFYVDRDPVAAARSLCDKHVVKMMLEMPQLLCDAFPKGDAPYGQTHLNHPSAVWARSGAENYDWLVRHGLTLCDEYRHRYGKDHRSEAVIQWCNFARFYIDLPDVPFWDPPQCVPPKCREDDTVESYRRYYFAEKSYLARWERGREAPSWYSEPRCRECGRRLTEIEIVAFRENVLNDSNSNRLPPRCADCYARFEEETYGASS